MAQQIRRGVFETNSSSTHSITICSPEDFELLKEGECDNKDLREAYEDMQSSDVETYVETYITPTGDKIVLFGDYGRDG